VNTTTLVRCDDCGSQVSARADKCIHCGAPRIATVAVVQRNAFARTLAPKQKCTVCHHEGRINRVGWDFSSILILIVLFCFLIVPGLVYLIWRGSQANKPCCARCKSLGVVRF
jgi:hypothetical protein